MDEDQMPASADGDDVSQAVLQSAGPGASLEISRPRRGSADLFRSYHVLVDGDDVGEVRRGESWCVQIAAGRHEVHLVIDWCRSPSVDIDVAPGETVKLVCWPKFQAWRARQGLANPTEYIVLVHSRDIDG
jgi:hypothetical protein